MTSGAPAGQPASLGRAAAGISGLTAASRATGFARVLVATAVLGTTYLGNTYQSANTVPNILFELFAAGALHAVLVPTLVEVLDGHGRAEAERVAGAVAGAATAGLAVVAAAAMAASPFVMRILVAGVDDPSVRDAEVRLGTVLLLVFLPQIVLYGVGLVATGALHAERRFTWPAAAPIANNVVVIVAYVWFWAMYRDASAWPGQALSPAEVAVLAGGTTLGVVALTMVPVVALRRSGFRLRLRWQPRDARVRRLARHGGWAVVQVLATQVVLIVVLVLANAVQGGVVAFQFALTFFLLPFALVAVPVATAVFPALSRSSGTTEKFSPTAGRAIIAVAALLLPAAAALAALSWPLVRVAAFGQATATGLAPLAHAIAALAPGLLGYGLVLLLTRVGYARGDARTPALVVLGALGAGAVVMAVLAPAAAPADRVTVLAAVHSAAYLAAAGVLWWLLDRRLAPSRFGAARTVAELAAAAVAVGVVMAVLARWLAPAGRVASAAVLAGAAGVGGAVYLAGVRLSGHRPRSLVQLGRG